MDNFLEIKNFCKEQIIKNDSMEVFHHIFKTKKSPRVSDVFY